jgi:hypothetical protein
MLRLAKIRRKEFLRTTTPCKGDTCGLLALYPVTASSFHFIGKETERGCEQSEDISTLLPSLMRYQECGVAGEQLRQRLLQVPIDVLGAKRA